MEMNSTRHVWRTERGDIWTRRGNLPFVRKYLQEKIAEIRKPSLLVQTSTGLNGMDRKWINMPAKDAVEGIDFFKGRLQAVLTEVGKFTSIRGGLLINWHELNPEVKEKE